MVTAGADADLPHQVGLPAPVRVAAGEDWDEARLQHVLLVAVAGVLVLAKRVHCALAGEHARVDRARVHLLHLAVQAFHPSGWWMVGIGSVLGLGLGVVAAGGGVLSTLSAGVRMRRKISRYAWPINHVRAPSVI